MADAIDTATKAVMEMETREEPDFIQFTRGDVVEGVLLSIELIKVKGKDGTVPKECTRYTLRTDDGKRVAFLGTHQINSKLYASDRGHRIIVTCTGEDEKVQRNGNPMKTFVVRVSKSAVADVVLSPVSNSGAIQEISDDDIPF